jgi:hypothetical protein
MRVNLEFKPQDLWIGAYWKRARWIGGTLIHIWICVLPCLPIHIRWYRRDR